MIYLASPQSITAGAEILRDGGLVAFPTETVYGLGADATNEKAVRALFELKGRPSNNPLIVHTHSISEIDYLTGGRLTNTQRSQVQALNAFWPGPLTVVVPRGPAIALAVTSGGDSVGIRIPKHPVATNLIRELGRPICAPSANPSGYVSPTCAAHVEESFGDVAPVTIDGGPCAVGIESTVLSLLGPMPEILRPGAVTPAMIEAALGIPLARMAASTHENDHVIKLSPGLLTQHYSPQTPLIIEGTLEHSAYPSKVGIIRMRPPAKNADRFPYACVATLSTSGNLEEIARGLFATIREFDTRGLDLIIVEPCQSEGLGSAIMDRISRAAAKAPMESTPNA